MLQAVKILLFLLVNAGGFYVLPVLLAVAAKFELLPDVPPGPMFDSFRFWLMTLGPWVWVVSALASVGYFFARGEMKTALLLAPLYVPAIYDIGVMVYFTYARVV